MEIRDDRDDEESVEGDPAVSGEVEEYTYLEAIERNVEGVWTKRSLTEMTAEDTVDANTVYESKKSLTEAWDDSTSNGTRGVVTREDMNL